MTGRHGGRPPVPFWAAVLALVIVIGEVVVLSDGRSPSPPSGRSGGAGSPAPSQAAPPAEPRGSLLLHGTGDVSLDPSSISTYATQGYDSAWSGLDDLLRRDDLTVGVEVANLGNNHSYDFGPDSLVDGAERGSRPASSPWAPARTWTRPWRPGSFDLEGWRVAVLGLDQVVDPFPDAVATATKPGTAAGHDTHVMIDAIRAASAPPTSWW